MADTPQTLALLILAQQYAGDIVRTINRRAQLIRMIPIIPGEGKNVAWAVEYDGAVAEYYADGADAANFGSDAQTQAILAWALARANARVTGLAMSSAATSQTPRGNVNLWGRNVQNSLATLAATINSGCFSGNGAASPKEITGLDTALGSTTNTYATIDRTSVTYFDPYLVEPGSATNISQDQIRTDLAGIYTACGEYPDLAVCTPAVFNSVLGMYDSRTQLVKQVDQIQTARGTIQLSGNYRAMEVEGTMFIKDKDATAGQIYYLNTNYVRLVPQVQPQYREMGLVPGEMVTANDGFGPVPLMAVFEALAKTGDSQKYQAKTYIELCVSRPNACGLRKNVAYS